MTRTYASTYQRYISVGAQSANFISAASVTTCTVLLLLLFALMLGRTVLALASKAGGRGVEVSTILGEAQECTIPIACSSVYVFAVFLFAWTCRRTMRAFGELCATLSPESDSERIHIDHIPLWKLAVSYSLYSAFVGAATLYTLCIESIVWAGVRFTVRHGRVMQMHRRDANDVEFTVAREESLENSLRSLAQTQIKAGLWT